MAKSGIQNKGLRQLKDLLHLTGTSPAIILIPILYSLVAALSEGVSLSLLMPLVNLVVGASKTVPSQITFLNFIQFPIPGLCQLSPNNLILVLGGLVFISASAKSLFIFLGNTHLNFRIQRFLHLLRCNLFDRYLVFGKGFYDKNKSGKLNGIITGSTFKLAAILPSLQVFSTTVFLLVIYLFILFSISWCFTLIIVATLPLFLWWLKAISHKLKHLSKSQTKVTNEFNQLVFETISCLPLIRSYSMEDREKSHFEGLSKSMATTTCGINQKNNIISFGQEVTNVTIILLLLVIMTAFLVGSGNLSFSRYLIYILVARRTMNALGTLSHIKAALASLTGVLDEIHAMLTQNYDKQILLGGNKAFQGLQHNIEFDHLDFSYDGRSPILKDVTFTIKKGDIITLAGRSGAGKTTLINLLQQFYPCHRGSIKIDGIPIQEFTLESLREHMAVVGQDVLLFNQSLSYNLSYGIRHEITRDEMWDVLEKVNLLDFVAALPRGLKTTIGDRGAQLSGGQRQRLSIARAMLKRADILLLDEPTSAVDPRTEELIQQALWALLDQKTLFIISQHHGSPLPSNRTIVLEQGRVLEARTERFSPVPRQCRHVINA